MIPHNKEHKHPLTYSVYKQLWFAGEVVVDNIVQHRDINTSSLCTTPQSRHTHGHIYKYTK